jgi:hypothetical protein
LQQHDRNEQIASTPSASVRMPESVGTKSAAKADDRFLLLPSAAAVLLVVPFVHLR